MRFETPYYLIDEKRLIRNLEKILIITALYRTKMVTS